MKEERQIEAAMKRYADMVRRICFVYLKNYHDVEDVFQEVFLKYALREENFASQEHEKAWFIRVSVNACKDILKSFFFSRVDSLETMTEELSCVPEESKGVLAAVCELPEKYRMVLYMFYYEGYTAAEIGRIIRKKENTVYTWLSRAKKQLKSGLGGDFLG